MHCFPKMFPANISVGGSSMLNYVYYSLCVHTYAHEKNTIANVYV